MDLYFDRNGMKCKLQKNSCTVTVSQIRRVICPFVRAATGKYGPIVPTVGTSTSSQRHYKKLEQARLSTIQSFKQFGTDQPFNTALSWPCRRCWADHSCFHIVRRSILSWSRVQNHHSVLTKSKSELWRIYTSWQRWSSVVMGRAEGTLPVFPDPKKEETSVASSGCDDAPCPG